MSVDNGRKTKRTHNSLESAFIRTNGRGRRQGTTRFKGSKNVHELETDTINAAYRTTWNLNTASSSVGVSLLSQPLWFSLENTLVMGR